MDGGAVNKLNMQEQPSNSFVENDEITLKELIELGKKYSSLLWRRKLVYVFFFLFISLFFFYKFLKHQDLYEAPLTFMINEESSGSSAFSGILGQFGFGGSSGDVNREKVKYLISSNKIQQQAFFDTVTIESEKTLLINKIIDTYELDKELSNKYYDFEGYRYSGQLNTEDRFETTFFKKISKFINDDKNKIISTSLDDDTGIFTLSALTPLDELSIAISDQLYEKLSEFYVTQAIERQGKSHQIIKKKVDSIEAEISKVNYGLANYRDKSQSVWSSKANIRLEQLEQERMKLASMYTEAVKNYEFSSYNLQTQTPVFQIVDRPFLPIFPETFSIIKSAISIILISAFLYVGYVIMHQIYIENT